MNKYEIALFMVIRNNTVLPVGIRKKKSIEEINRMAYETMLEIINGDTMNWEQCKEAFEQGKELFYAEAN